MRFPGAPISTRLLVTRGLAATRSGPTERRLRRRRRLVRTELIPARDHRSSSSLASARSSDALTVDWGKARRFDALEPDCCAPHPMLSPEDFIGCAGTHAAGAASWDQNGNCPSPTNEGRGFR